MTAGTVIVQHGEKLPEPGDPALSSRGRRQALHVAAALSPRSPALVVSSPLLRARQTVQPLAATLGTDIQIDSRLRERLNFERGKDPERFAADWERSIVDRQWVSAGGRSSSATGIDMQAVLADFTIDDRLTVLASHGGATTDLLRQLLGDDLLRQRAPGLIEHGVPGGALTTLSYDGRRWTVDVIADVRHIPVPDRSGHEPGRV